jgi:filamentous hemagglutinin family protein
MTQILCLRPNQFGCLIAIGSIFSTFDSSLVQAQVTGDGTLGTQVNGSVSSSCTGVCIINAGTERGKNLFHSFRDFSVASGGEAWFNNSPQVQHILTRVTGDAISNIDGLIKANGNAHLFFLNPNGIAFGPNARLQIGGSLVASTANRFQFADGSEFGTINRSVPALLNIDLIPGLQYGKAIGNITQAGNLAVSPGQSLTLFGSTVSHTGLLTAPGGTVQLLGDRVVLPAPSAIDVFSPTKGGTLVIGGTANLTIVPDPAATTNLVDTGEQTIAVGAVSALLNTNSLTLQATNTIDVNADVIANNTNALTLQASNINLNDASLQQSGGGNIVLDTTQNCDRPTATTQGTAVVINGANLPGNNIDPNLPNRNLPSDSIGTSVPNGANYKGGNIEIITGSLVLNSADLETSSFGQGDAGNIKLTIGEAAILDRRSGAVSIVYPGAVGNTGTVELTARSLTMTNQSRLGTSTQPDVQGNTSSVKLNIGESLKIDNSAVFTNVDVGNAAAIEINAGSLVATNGGILNADTLGRGNAGDIQITVRDRVLFQGVGINGASVASSFVYGTGEGQGGNIVIDAGSLELRDSAQLIVSNNGKGNAGNVRITVRGRVLLQGARGTREEFSSSGILSSVEPTGEGQGGNIVIDAGSLELRDGGQLVAAASGKGNAGNIQITVRDRAIFQGEYDGFLASAAFTVVGSIGQGQGGNIVIDAGSLEVRDGAGLFAFTIGKGDAGKVRVTARDRIILDGTNPIGGGSSAISAANERVSTGKGGDVLLTTAQLQVSNGAILDSRTENDQPGGDIILNVDRLDLLSGGQILSSSDGNGAAGTVRINATQQLRITGTDPTYNQRLSTFPLIDKRVIPVTPNSGIYARSNRTGSAGNIILTTPRLLLDHQGQIIATSNAVNGGNIILNPQDVLLLRRNSLISATAGTAQSLGDGGNITIESPNGFIVGIPRENSDITANAFTGKGGRVEINAKNLFGIQARPQLSPLSDITASSESGPTGSVNITPPDIDPNRGLVPLPAALTDPSNKIDRTCAAGSNDSSSQFVVLGQSGLPARPQDNANAMNPIARLAKIPASSSSAINQPQPADRPTSNPIRIVEAQTAIRQSNGLIRFAAAPKTNASISTLPAPKCQPNL